MQAVDSNLYYGYGTIDDEGSELCTKNTFCIDILEDSIYCIFSLIAFISKLPVLIITNSIEFPFAIHKNYVLLPCTE